jgi:hypothetical protein
VSAVGNAAKEGLGPVPGGVEADGPPERAGAPEAEAEDQGDQYDGEQSDGIFAVGKAEKEGQDHGGSPEGERFAGARLNGPRVEASDAAGQRVLDVAPEKRLLEQADEKKAKQPDCPITENVGTKEQAAVDDEKSGLPEGQALAGRFMRPAFFCVEATAPAVSKRDSSNRLGSRLGATIPGSAAWENARLHGRFSVVTRPNCRDSSLQITRKGND